MRICCKKLQRCGRHLANLRLTNYGQPKLVYMIGALIVLLSLFSMLKNNNNGGLTKTVLRSESNLQGSDIHGVFETPDLEDQNWGADSGLLETSPRKRNKIPVLKSSNEGKLETNAIHDPSIGLRKRGQKPSFDELVDNTKEDTGGNDDVLGDKPIRRQGIGLLEETVAPGECIYEERLETIRSFCRQNVKLYNPILLNNPKNFGNFFVNKQDKTIHCGLPIAGDVHWDTLTFEKIGRPLILPNMSLSEQQVDILKEAGLGRLSDFSSEEIKQMLKEFRRVILVQHPMARILTAYWLLKMDQKWRASPDVQNFFLNPAPKLRLLQAKDITFGKFVEYALSDGFSDNYNLIRPISDMCMPCALQFDMILKAETIKMTLKHDILAYETLFHAYPFNITVRNFTQFEQYGHLIPDVMEKVLDVYEDDLLLFAYHWDNVNNGAICKQPRMLGKDCC